VRVNPLLSCAFFGAAWALLIAPSRSLEATPVNAQHVTRSPAPSAQGCVRWRAWRELEGALGYDPLPELLDDPQAEHQQRLWRGRSRRVHPLLSPSSSPSSPSQLLTLSDAAPLSLLTTPRAQLYFHAERVLCPQNTRPHTLPHTLQSDTLTLRCSHPVKLWLNGVLTTLTPPNAHRWRVTLSAPVHSLTLRLSPLAGRPRCELEGGPLSLPWPEQRLVQQAQVTSLPPSQSSSQAVSQASSSSEESHKEGVHWWQTNQEAERVIHLDVRLPLTRPSSGLDNHTELLKTLWTEACGRVKVTRAGWAPLSDQLKDQFSTQNAPTRSATNTPDENISGVYELKASCVGLPPHLALLAERWRPPQKAPTSLKRWRFIPLNDHGVWRGVGLMHSQGAWLLNSPLQTPTRPPSLEWVVARTWAEVSVPYRIALQLAQLSYKEVSAPSRSLTPSQQAVNRLSALSPAWLTSVPSAHINSQRLLQRLLQRPLQPVLRSWGSTPLPPHIKRALPSELWWLWRSLTPALTPNAPALIPAYPLSDDESRPDEPFLTPLWLVWRHLKGAWGERCEREWLEEPRALLWAPRGTLFGERTGAPPPQALPYLGLRCGEERISLDMSPLPSGALSLDLAEGGRSMRVSSEAELSPPLEVRVTWAQEPLKTLAPSPQSIHHPQVRPQASPKAHTRRWRVMWGALHQLDQPKTLPPWPLMGLESWGYYAEASRPHPSRFTPPRMAAPDLLWALNPHPKAHQLTHPWATSSWWRLPPRLTPRAYQELWAEALAGEPAEAWESGRGAHTERLALSARFRLMGREASAHLPLTPLLRRKLTYPQGTLHRPPAPSLVIKAPFGHYEHQTTLIKGADGLPQRVLTTSLSLNLKHVNPQSSRWHRFAERVEKAERALERSLKQALEGDSKDQLLMHTPR
jgi:hypothetical protein